MASVSVNNKEIKRTNPLVTIALPVFNGSGTLVIAIESVLNQIYENFELIIIDDKSTDESLKIVTSFSDKRINLIENEKNIGLSACINFAVSISKGIFFARMDQDDICFSNRIEKQVSYMLDNLDVDLLATASLIFDEKSEILGVLPVRTNHEAICNKPLAGFYMPHPTWMGRIEWFRSNTYHSYANGAEDQQLLFRCYKNSRFACLSEPLLAYRERRRKLAKMFKSRLIFAKSISSYAWNNKRKGDSFKIIILQCMKFMGDIIYAFFKLNTMRNTLNKPDQHILHTWENMVRQYNIKLNV